MTERVMVKKITVVVKQKQHWIEFVPGQRKIGIHLMCVCLSCVARAFFYGVGGFAKQNWDWSDLLWRMTDWWRKDGRASQSWMTDEGRRGRKKDRPHSEWQKIRDREKDSVSKNSPARGLWWQPWATQTRQSSVPLRQHVDFIIPACVC